MKAVQYTTFGTSEVLRLQQTDKPTVKDKEVLIQVKATTINPLDMKIRSGYMQKMMPVQFPVTPGLDASGTIAAVGNKVSRFKVGDEVMATSQAGGYAEYMVTDEDRTIRKPASISFNEAAALAIPIATAYAVLVEAGQLQPGQKIFIQGAAGAVGNMMLQMAKALGAYVIGTASGTGVDMIQELGADEAIDYKTTDFSGRVKDMDIVADLVGGPGQAALFAMVKKGGKLLTIVMPPPPELAEKFGISASFVQSNANYEKLAFGLSLLEQGKIKPVVAAVMKLEEAAAAQDLVTAGGVNGKLVLEVS